MDWLEEGQESRLTGVMGRDDGKRSESRKQETEGGIMVASERLAEFANSATWPPRKWLVRRSASTSGHDESMHKFGDGDKEKKTLRLSSLLRYIQRVFGCPSEIGRVGPRDGGYVTGNGDIEGGGICLDFGLDLGMDGTGGRLSEFPTSAVVVIILVTEDETEQRTELVIATAESISRN